MTESSYINRLSCKCFFKDVSIVIITSVCELNRCRFFFIHENVKLSIAKTVVGEFFIVFVRKQQPDSNCAEPDNLLEVCVCVCARERENED